MLNFQRFSGLNFAFTVVVFDFKLFSWRDITACSLAIHLMSCSGGASPYSEVSGDTEEASPPPATSLNDENELDLVDPPALTFTNPTENPFQVNNENASSITLSGTCSEVGRPIQISGAVTGSTNCSNNNTWSRTLSFESVINGQGSVVATHSNAAGQSVSVSRSFVASFIWSAEIASISDLTNNIREYRAGSYQLTQDIDLSGVEWTHANQLGSSTNPFTGTLDGQGFKIKNLKSPDAFIGFARGATIKNITFENMRLGENSESTGRGLVLRAYQNSSGAPTRIENIHVTNAQIFGQVDSASDKKTLANAGALIGDGFNLEILNSSVEVIFKSNRPGLSSVGGFVGRLENRLNNPTAAEAHINRIENSRAHVRFEYTPEVAWSHSSIELAYIGGLVGFTSDAWLEKDNLVKFKQIDVDFEFKNAISSDRGAHISGLLGRYWLSYASDPHAYKLQIEQAQVAVNIESNFGAGSPTSVAGLFDEFPASGSSFDRETLIRDVRVTGKIRNTSDINISTPRFAGLVTSSFSSPNHDRQLKFEQVYSNVEMSSAGSLQGFSPFYRRGSSLAQLPTASGAFYNADLIASGVSADSVALPLTTNQMHSPSTWLNAGYSQNIWEILSGAIPLLRNTFVDFP